MRRFRCGGWRRRCSQTCPLRAWRPAWCEFSSSTLRRAASPASAAHRARTGGDQRNSEGRRRGLSEDLVLLLETGRSAPGLPLVRVTSQARMPSQARASAVSTALRCESTGNPPVLEPAASVRSVGTHRAALWGRGRQLGRLPVVGEQTVRGTVHSHLATVRENPLWARVAEGRADHDDRIRVIAGDDLQGLVSLLIAMGLVL